MKTAMITGASAGLGAEFARQLASTVDRLVLVARRRDRLETLAAELWQQKTSLHIEVRAVDLSDPVALQGLLDWIATQEVDLLINNAGSGDLGLFETAPPLKLQQMMRVNMEALTLLTRAVVPGLVARGGGRILNVSSTAGVLPLPTFSVYAATKAYVTSFSEALKAELQGTGVTVTCLCPGPVSTEFGVVATRPDGRREFAPPSFFIMPASIVVRQALAGLRTGRARVVPGLGLRLFYWWAEGVPWIFWRLVFYFGKYRKLGAGAEAESPSSK